MNIVKKLEKLGFSENMALVYIELLKNPGYNGTQIHKNLSLPRSSVYKALDELLEFEYINLIPSEQNLKNYTPVKPSEIMSKIKKEYEEILKTIGIELEQIYNPKSFYEVYNITGRDNIYYKLMEMINTAKKNILISGNIDENLIDNKLNIKIDNINKGKKDEVFIIIDNEEILVYNINENYAVGIYTKNNIIIKKYSDFNC